MSEMLKKIVLWNYSRGTWQYDLFCLLIIAFIFLTPKAWFEKRENLATQTPAAAVKSEDFSKISDRSESPGRAVWQDNRARAAEHRQK